MALTIFPVPGKLKSDLICKAFAAGAPKSAKGAVFFGTEGQMSAFRKAQVNGLPWYYIDNSYFDKHRGTYFRVTKNALQVDPTMRESDGTRFARLGVPIKPWRAELGNTILVCPQSDDFMKSTLGFKHDWTADTVALLKSFDLPYTIRVRPWLRDKVKASVMLLDELPHLRLLVTYSSSAAITAMLEGTPAISMSGAARTLTGPLMKDSVLSPPTPGGRLHFARVLADNQFTLEEFRNGKAWRWLER
jgi:hypothetical protein